MSDTKIDFDKFLDDFRRLNPKDIGSWPIAPKATLLCALFLIVVFLGWMLVWQEEQTTLEGLQTKEITLKEDFKTKKQRAVNLEKYKQQLSEIDRSFGTLLKQLPNKAEVESLLSEINQAGMKRGLQFDLFKPESESVREFYAELPISVKLAGGYHDLGAFAADLSRMPRIVTLNDINITSGKDGSLSLDAQIKTFRYLDEDEIKQQKTSKGGQK